MIIEVKVGDPTVLTSRRAQHAAALESELNGLVRQLECMPEVKQVVLFGSYAAGRRDLFTDLDVLVIMESSLAFVARNADLARRVRIGVPVDLMAYTCEEVERMRERPFLRHALATGKVLYERKSA